MCHYKAAVATCGHLVELHRPRARTACEETVRQDSAARNLQAYRSQIGHPQAVLATGVDAYIHEPPLIDSQWSKHVIIDDEVTNAVDCDGCRYGYPELIEPCNCGCEKAVWSGSPLGWKGVQGANKCTECGRQACIGGGYGVPCQDCFARGRSCSLVGYKYEPRSRLDLMPCNYCRDRNLRCSMKAPCVHCHVRGKECSFLPLKPARAGASNVPTRTAPGPAYGSGGFGQASGSSAMGAPQAGQASRASDAYMEPSRGTAPRRGGSSSDFAGGPGQTSGTYSQTRPPAPFLNIPRTASPAQLSGQQFSLASRPASRASLQTTSQARRDPAVGRTPIEIMPGPRPPSPDERLPLEARLAMAEAQVKWHESREAGLRGIRFREDLDDLYNREAVYDPQPREYGRSVAEQLMNKRKASKSPSPTATPMPQPTECGRIIADDPQLASESRDWGPGQWHSFIDGLHDSWSTHQQPPQVPVSPRQLSSGAPPAPAAKKPKKGESSSGKKGESSSGKKGESSSGKRG